MNYREIGLLASWSYVDELQLKDAGDYNVATWGGGGCKRGEDGMEDNIAEGMEC